MKKELTAILRQPLVRQAALWLLALVAVTGCRTETSNFGDTGKPDPGSSQIVGLREGDVLKISFPGAPTLNTTQQVRTDGGIELPLGGQLKVVGMTVDQLEKELVNRFASQLLNKEVMVTIESASFPVYVTGAVLHPGKVLSNRPISALEAIMEAGGADNTKANLKAVAVTRSEGGQIQHYTLDLKSVLQGQQSKPFYLRPSDIVFVPEKFTWF